MNLQQLRSVREVAAQGLNLTRAAQRLNTTQPGVTRHLQIIEQELGVSLFVRSGKRLTGLTALGRTLLPIIGRVLNGVDDIRQVARDFASGAEGEVTVATVHTHIRYVLPPVIERFVRECPAIRVRLREGNREEAAFWVRQGEADFSLATMPAKPFPELVFHPCYNVHRVVLVRARHPLLGHAPLSLQDVAAYPIITYANTSDVHGEIMRSFQLHGLQPNIVLGANEIDTIKTYVRCGLGIGIVADIACDKAERDLRAVDARHLFPSTSVRIGIRRNEALASNALRLIRLLAPEVHATLDGNA